MRSLVKNKWITFPEDKDIQFKVKPFSILHLKFIPTQNTTEELTSDTMWSVFNASVVDWKGINGEDGTTLVCNEKNKRIVAEAYDDILIWIVNHSFNAQETKVSEPEIKN